MSNKYEPTGPRSATRKGPSVLPPSLFDEPGAERARDRAIAEVDAHADPLWKSKAMEAVYQVALRQETFTTDDVWGGDVPAPAEPRALGAIMRAAAKARWIVRTSATQESRRRVAHRGPKTVWRSLIVAEHQPSKGSDEPPTPRSSEPELLLAGDRVRIIDGPWPERVDALAMIVAPTDTYPQPGPREVIVLLDDDPLGYEGQPDWWTCVLDADHVRKVRS